MQRLDPANRDWTTLAGGGWGPTSTRLRLATRCSGRGGIHVSPRPSVCPGCPTRALPLRRAGGIHVRLRHARCTTFIPRLQPRSIRDARPGTRRLSKALTERWEVPPPDLRK